jgi:hypothetical protein
LHKSLTSLAAVAAFILLLDVPVVGAAQSQAQFPAESKEATTDRTAFDAFAAAQARLAFSLIEKVANGNNAAAPCQSRCMPMAPGTSAVLTPRYRPRASSRPSAS